MNSPHDKATYGPITLIYREAAMHKAVGFRDWWLFAALLVVGAWLAVAVGIGLAAIIGAMAGMLA